MALSKIAEGFTHEDTRGTRVFLSVPSIYWFIVNFRHFELFLQLAFVISLPLVSSVFISSINILPSPFFP